MNQATLPWEFIAERYKPIPEWALTVIVDNDKTPRTTYQVWVYLPGEVRDECGHNHRYYRRAEECEQAGKQILRDRGWRDVRSDR